MTHNHWFWAFARPTLMWSCMPLLFLALHPDVSDVKFQTACGLTFILYIFRGVVDKGWVERVIEKWRS